MGELVHFLVQSVSDLGYLGIFILMFLESSFFPFPSEVVMIPAGFLAFKGEMNITLAILAGTFGSLAGALFNYLLAIKYGRTFLLRYGKYFFLDEKKLANLERFFSKHGAISTFSGRLIPGIRQYISLPAGLAKMNIAKFSLYTTLGASIWVVVLAMIGYLIGQNQELITQYLHTATLIALLCIAVIVAFYVVYNKKKS